MIDTIEYTANTFPYQCQLYPTFSVYLICVLNIQPINSRWPTWEIIPRMSTKDHSELFTYKLGLDVHGKHTRSLG